MVAFARNEGKERAKHDLQRLTQDNIKLTGRNLARLTHAVPEMIAQVLVTQLASYPNLIAPVVETLRYLTPLSLDVLLFTFIAHLATQEATRPEQAKQPDGVTPALWLTSTAQALGLLCRKYAASGAGKLDLAPLLHYLFRLLRADKSAQLVVLQELLAQLGDEMHDEEAYERQARIAPVSVSRALTSLFRCWR